MYRPYICEFPEAGHPVPVAYSGVAEEDTLLSKTVVGLASGPHVSFSSCLAYCAGKGAATAMFSPTKCACVEETVGDVAGAGGEALDECVFPVPCAGNPSQVKKIKLLFFRY